MFIWKLAPCLFSFLFALYCGYRIDTEADPLTGFKYMIACRAALVFSVGYFICLVLHGAITK